MSSRRQGDGRNGVDALDRKDSDTFIVTAASNGSRRQTVKGAPGSISARLGDVVIKGTARGQGGARNESASSGSASRTRNAGRASKRRHPAQSRGSNSSDVADRDMPMDGPSDSFPASKRRLYCCSLVIGASTFMLIVLTFSSPYGSSRPNLTRTKTAADASQHPAEVNVLVHVDNWQSMTDDFITKWLLRKTHSRVRFLSIQRVNDHLCLKVESQQQAQLLLRVDGFTVGDRAVSTSVDCKGGGSTT
jgi:hypothetical protein